MTTRAAGIRVDIPVTWITSAWWARLSDCARVVLVGALAHSATQGTDGELSETDYRYLHPTASDAGVRSALGELQAQGRGHFTPNGFVMDDWTGKQGQNSAEHIANQRESNRQRQAEWRERQRQERERERLELAAYRAASGSEPILTAPDAAAPLREDPISVTRYETGDVTSHVGKDRSLTKEPTYQVDAHAREAEQSDGSDWDLPTVTTGWRGTSADLAAIGLGSSR